MCCPIPLILNNGKPMHNAKTWWKKRRPELLAMFETQQYGGHGMVPSDGTSTFDF
jgi:hypothetical protein